MDENKRRNETVLKLVIFGAKSIALGVCRAVQELYKDFMVMGFLVSSREGNPDMLAGLPVYELRDYPQKDVCVLIATPEDIQGEIVRLLEEHGFHNHICVDSSKEMFLMERYYIQTGEFISLHALRNDIRGKNEKVWDRSIYGKIQ